FNALFNQARRSLFQQNAAAAQLHGFHEVVLTVGRSEQDDFASRRSGLKVTDNSKPVNSRQLNVREKNIRVQLNCLFNCVYAIGRLTDDLNTRIWPKDMPQA